MNTPVQYIFNNSRVLIYETLKESRSIPFRKSTSRANKATPTFANARILCFGCCILRPSECTSTYLRQVYFFFVRTYIVDIMNNTLWRSVYSLDFNYRFKCIIHLVVPHYRHCQRDQVTTEFKYLSCLHIIMCVCICIICEPGDYIITRRVLGIDMR